MKEYDRLIAKRTPRETLLEGEFHFGSTVYYANWPNVYILNVGCKGISKLRRKQYVNKTLFNVLHSERINASQIVGYKT